MTYSASDLVWFSSYSVSTSAYRSKLSSAVLFRFLVCGSPGGMATPPTPAPALLRQLPLALCAALLFTRTLRPPTCPVTCLCYTHAACALHFFYTTTSCEERLRVHGNIQVAGGRSCDSRGEHCDGTVNGAALDIRLNHGLPPDLFYVLDNQRTARWR